MTETEIDYDPEKRPNKPYKFPARTLYTEEEALELAANILKYATSEDGQE